MDVELPGEIPVAELMGDVVDMLGEADDEVPAGWSLTRVGGRPLDVERSLADQGVTSGMMLFLRDSARPVAPAEIDDFSEQVAIAVDAQGGRWSLVTAELLLAYFAGACLFAAGLIALLGDRGVRTVVGLSGAALATVAVTVAARVVRRKDIGGLIALAALPLWAAAGAGVAGFAGADPTGIVAAALGAVSAGAVVAIVLAGGMAVVPAAGVIAGTLAPALITGGCAIFGAKIYAAAALLVPVTLVGFALAPSAAVRLLALDVPGTGSLDARVGQGRGLLAGLLTGLASALVVSNAILVLRGGWFAWGLVAAGAVACLVKARLFRFAGEVAPLLVAGLAGLFVLQLPLVLQLPMRGWGGAAAVLVVDGLVVLAVSVWVRQWNPAPVLLRQLAWIETLATVASVPLSVGVLGAFEAVQRFARGLG